MHKKLLSLTLILGGAASGKSVFSENIMVNSGLSPAYIATSRIWDAEIGERVRIHKSRRGAEWLNIEAPLELDEALGSLAPGQAVLIDCATMWLTNHVMDGSDLHAAQGRLLQALANAPVPVIVVSNEIGQGIVPMDADTRAFREAQGRLNITLAAQADCVVQVVAGLPNILKGQLS